MTEEEGGLLDEQGWRKYAQDLQDRNATGVKVELDIGHKGFHFWSFTPLMRVAREELPGGQAVEVWRTMTQRDKASTFQVFLPKGETLLTHMEDVKYFQTSHGRSVVMSLVVGGLVAFEAFLLYVIFSGQAPAIDPLSPLFIVPLTASISVVVSSLAFGNSRYCKAVSLECGDPDGEQGANHVCVVVGSSVASVVEQVGAMAACKDLFAKAQENLRRTMSKQADAKDIYIAQMQNQDNRVEVDLAGWQARFMNRVAGWNRQHRPAADGWRRWAGLAIVAGVAVVAIVSAVLYFHGA